MAPDTDGGLFAALRRLLTSGVELLRVRLALLGTDIEQEKLRLFDAVLWAGLALLLLGMGLLLLCALVVVLLWEQQRLPALAALAALCLGGGAWLLRRARARLRAPGGLFAASVAELARDRAGLSEPE